MKIDDKLEKTAQKFKPGEELIHTTVSKMDEYTRHEERKSSHKNILTVKLAFIITIILITAGLSIDAYARGWFSDLLNLFSERFGNNKNQMEIISNEISSSGVSVVNNGLRITADGKLTEDKLLVIGFSVKREDGTALVDKETDSINKIVIGGASYESDQPLIWVSSQARSNEKKANNYYGMYEAVFFEYFLIPGDTPQYINLSFNRPEVLCDNGIRIPLTDTSVFSLWNFNIPVQKTDETRNWDVVIEEGQRFEANGETFELTELYLSSMILLADYKVISDTPSNRVVHSSQNAAEYQEQVFWKNISLALKLKDGRLIDMSSFTDNNGIVNIRGLVEIKEKEDCFVIHMGGVLPEAIPYEEMDCILFNGTEYPINFEEE